MELLEICLSVKDERKNLDITLKSDRVDKIQISKLPGKNLSDSSSASYHLFQAMFLPFIGLFATCRTELVINRLFGATLNLTLPHLMD